MSQGATSTFSNSKTGCGKQWNNKVFSEESGRRENTHESERRSVSFSFFFHGRVYYLAVRRPFDALRVLAGGVR